MLMGDGWLKPAKVTASAALLSLALSGCGGFDGVELNGAVFDYLGVSGSSQKKGEPKVAARSGLVLPPDLEKLPEPGSGVAAAPGGPEAWPDDPDQKKVAVAAELDRRHEEFCREALWKAKARGQVDEIIQGPKGPCNPSIFRNLTGKEIPTGSGSAPPPTPR